MTEPTKRAAGSTTTGRSHNRKPSTSPTGTSRAGRRETPRRRYHEPSTVERFRTPIIALAVIAVVVAVGAFVFTSASSATYACSTVDTVQPPDRTFGVWPQTCDPRSRVRPVTRVWVKIRAPPSRAPSAKAYVKRDGSR